MHRRDLRLPSPCPLSPAARSRRIQPDGHGGLWCDHCRAPVHALAVLGPEAAHALVERGSGCVHAELRRDGSVAWTTRRSGRVTLRIGLVAAVLASGPAVASISREPGAAVGLLDWMWSQVAATFAAPDDLRPVCDRGIDPTAAHRIPPEPEVLRDPIAILPAEPSARVGRRDPFHSATAAMTGGLGLREEPPSQVPAPPAPRAVVSAPHGPASAPAWPPGIPLQLHTLPPVRAPGAVPSEHRVHEWREGGEQLGEHQQH